MHCLAFGLDGVQQKRADDVSCVALEINVTLTLLIPNYFPKIGEHRCITCINISIFQFDPIHSFIKLFT